MPGRIVPLAAIAAAAIVLIVAVVMNAPATHAADAPAIAGLQVIGGTPPVLFDPAGGKAWALVPSANLRQYIWVPIKRLDTDADIQKWQLTGKLKEDLEK